MKAVPLPASVQQRYFCGVAPAALPGCIALLPEVQRAPLALLLCHEQKRLESLLGDIQAAWRLQHPRQLLKASLYPSLEDLEDDDPRYFEHQCDRLAVLTQLQEKNRVPHLVLTTPAALYARVPAPGTLAARQLSLRVGQQVDFRALQEQLATEMDYDAEAVCETPGQFAVRGGLIDLYPLNADAPVRIDFFGDEIDRMRTFDPTTQRSAEPLEQITVAASAPLNEARSGSLLDYLPRHVCWLIDDPPRQEAAMPDFFTVPERLAAPTVNISHLLQQRERCNDCWLGLAALDLPSSLFASCQAEAVESESMEAYQTYSEEDRLGIQRQASEQASRSRFLQQLAAWQAAGHTVTLCIRQDSEAERLRELLDDEPALAPCSPLICTAHLSTGYRLAFAGKRHAVVTADEIFGRHRRLLRQRRRKLPEVAAVDQALDFSELADGDYLVHLQNGICIFRGLQKMELDGHLEEVIALEFAEAVTVYLRLHESHLLSRYVGLRKVAPKLGKIGGTQWEKSRAAAERATLDFAAELLRLQAERETQPGHAFAPDGTWMAQFEDGFPHEETVDQRSAIEATKCDMERPHPMDRLICGDVGFGKTEVAIRAAFKAVLDGKQVAVLIPTTVLCQQHFITFKERMAEHPVVVEMLSRFRSPRLIREIKQQLKNGQIDIIVGTHALLGRGIVFQDLGLLIIDEEHRFGVRQKEKIKHLRRHIDVLSMSATPIPRTLHSALVGVRQLSVIETAPRDRLPIQTIVKAYDPALVKAALAFELNRGGQVFYLHNRVQTIESVAARLRELLPEARLAIGHGQMEEDDLEQIMTDFVAGHYDILICTTIIESGLDIPNCNTIIIEGADRFGLSQLYQLRGRVGRFNRQAYCYLLLHRHARLMDLARKRLGAIRQFNQLGAGFRIAMRDLELRGAGNLLGAQQSGHIANVGFDLYCQLLRQSVSRLKGDPQAAAIRASLRLDFIVLGEQSAGALEAGPVDSGFDALKSDELARERIGPIEAALPASYLREPRLRIDFYRQLALATDKEAVEGIAEALRDRFGPPPPAVEALLLMNQIRVMAERRGIDLVATEGNRLKCRLAWSRPATFIQHGGRFPRLTARKPLARLREIEKFLARLTVS